MSTPARGATAGPRLGFEALEDRTTPTAAYTLSAGSLVSFDTDTPGTSTAVAVTGVAANEALVGIDFRAADHAERMVECDINPLIGNGRRIVAVDALIVKKSPV